jgi:hypothetical protein
MPIRVKGDSIWNFDIKPTDGAAIFAYLVKGVNFQASEIKRERCKMNWRWRDLNPNLLGGSSEF